MSQSTGGEGQGVIRITREEAESQHVDDLLRRQASLRGEGGIARDRKGKWYYKNWFLFSVAGALAAIAAWALIEPYFDDMFYLQGPLVQVSSDEPAPQQPAPRAKKHRVAPPEAGLVEVNGEKIEVLPSAEFLWSNGTRERANLASLKSGQEVGVYVLDRPYAESGLALSVFVVPDPPPNPPEKSRMPLAAQQAQNTAAGMLIFGVVAAAIGLAIGAVDGFVCRVYRRVLLAAAVGLLVGFIGGFVSGLLASLVYTPLNDLALRQAGDTASGLTTFGFLVQVVGRSLAWCLAGMAAGLGQGIALRSGRLLLYGFLGGIIGGLLGGLFFDPIDLLMGVNKPSAHWSRVIGLALIGATTGAMIGVVELLARDAWLRMVEGPLAGKEFLIFKDTMYLGASPKSEIYLFNDEAVDSRHAVIRSVGDNYEIENLCRERPARVNTRPLTRARLHHGDQITIGRTVFVFQKRKA